MRRRLPGPQPPPLAGYPRPRAGRPELSGFENASDPLSLSSADEGSEPRLHWIAFLALALLWLLWPLVIPAGAQVDAAASHRAEQIGPALAFSAPKPAS